MTRWAPVVVGAWMASTVAAIGQEAPWQLLQRFVGNPTTAFRPLARPPTPAIRPTIVPLPHLRPDVAPPPATQLSADDDSVPSAPLRSVATLPPSPRVAPPLPPSGASVCARALAKLGIVATPLPPVADGGCQITAPVAVTAFGGGDVPLSTEALITCDTATTLATWLRDMVQPAAEAMLDERVTGLRVAASYVCRNRNGQPDAEISEHAFGRAIDISAIRVAGRWLEVGATPDSADAAFLDAVRLSACGPFTTVLGPGSDAFHSNHFHLDLAVRRAAGPSRGLYCH